METLEVETVKPMAISLEPRTQVNWTAVGAEHCEEVKCLITTRVPATIERLKVLFPGWFATIPGEENLGIPKSVLIERLRQSHKEHKGCYAFCPLSSAANYNEVFLEFGVPAEELLFVDHRDHKEEHTEIFNQVEGKEAEFGMTCQFQGITFLIVGIGGFGSPQEKISAENGYYFYMVEPKYINLNQ